MLLLGWGPYALLYLYATVADVGFISPKLQMVQILPKPKESPTSSHLSVSLYHTFWLPANSPTWSLFHSPPSLFP